MLVTVWLSVICLNPVLKFHQINENISIMLRTELTAVYSICNSIAISTREIVNINN